MSSMDVSAEAAEEAAGAVAGIGRRAVRNTMLVLSARILSRVLALVTVIATSHYLSPVQFGDNQTVITYAALANVTLDLGYGTLYVREGSRHRDQIGAYLGVLLSFKTVAAVVSLVLVAGLLSLSGLSDLLWPAFAMMVTSAYSNLLRSTFYAVQRLGHESAAIVWETVLLFCLVILGIATHQAPAWFIWIYVIQYSVTGAYFAVVIVATKMAVPGAFGDIALLRRWLPTALTVGVTSILTTVYFNVDLPILQYTHPNDPQVGYYALAYKPFQALLFIPFTLRNIVFPGVAVYYQARSNRIQAAAEKLFRILLLLGWPCTVGLFLLAPQATSFLQLYGGAPAPALRILAIGIVFAFVDNTFVASLIATDHQRLFAKVALFGLLVNLLLDLVLIPPTGYIGAAVATSVTEAALVCCGVWAMWHVGMPMHPLQLGWRIIVSGLIMGGILIPTMSWHGPVVFLAVVGGGLVYLAALLLLRTADDEERDLIRRALDRGRRG